MGRLTPEKIERIRRAYNQDPNFTNVAVKEDLDRRTVMKYVRSGEQTIQSRGEPASGQFQPRLGTKSAIEGIRMPLSSRAFQLMKKNASAVDVAIKLGIEEQGYRNYRRQFLRLTDYEKLDKLYDELDADENLNAFTDLFERMKQEKMIGELPQLVNALKDAKSLREISPSYQNTIQELNRKKDEYRQLSSRIASSRQESINLEDELEQKKKSFDQLEYNITRVSLKIHDLEQTIRLLQKDKTHEKLVERIEADIIKMIKRKDRMMEFVVLSTLVSLRTLSREDKELVIKYAGQHDTLDETGKSKFHETNRVLVDKASKELPIQLAAAGIYDFDAVYEDVILMSQEPDDE